MHSKVPLSYHPKLAYVEISILPGAAAVISPASEAPGFGQIAKGALNG
jgi:hypothetical protein